MGLLNSRRRIWLAIGFLLAAAGCNTNDRDHLARAAIRAKMKLDNLTGGTENLATGWHGMTLDVRVSARLRWDKTLTGEKIQVTASGGVISLSGRVRDLNQRRRAVELAESTTGTEKVEDLLEVPEQP
jgi:hypothetical protein